MERGGSSEDLALAPAIESMKPHFWAPPSTPRFHQAAFAARTDGSSHGNHVARQDPVNLVQPPWLKKILSETTGRWGSNCWKCANVKWRILAVSSSNQLSSCKSGENLGWSLNPYRHFVGAGSLLVWWMQEDRPKLICQPAAFSLAIASGNQRWQWKIHHV